MRVLARRVVTGRLVVSTRPPRLHRLQASSLFVTALPVPTLASALPSTGSRASSSSSSAAGVPDAVPLVVALDLDECLVHSTNFVFGSGVSAPGDFRQHEVRPDIVEGDRGVEKFKLQMSGGATCTVIKRKGVDEFLKACSSDFETYIFTAGTRLYAEPLLDILDPERLLAGRLYRDDCSALRGLPGHQDQYLKDLSAIAKRAGRHGQDLARIVLVDNNPLSFICNPRNGVPVPHFLGDPDDVLPKVLELLRRLGKSSEDVRPHLHDMYALEDRVSKLQAKMLHGRKSPSNECDMDQISRL